MTTLYLTEPNTLVRKDGDTLLVILPEDKQKGVSKRKQHIPLIKVSQVVVMGNVTLTGSAIMALLERGVNICYCTMAGQFRGQLTSPLNKNSLLRVEQHLAHHDEERRFALARAFVRSKLSNMRTVLLRANRKRKDEAIARAVEKLGKVVARLDELEADQTPPDPARPQKESAYGSLLGLEGAGTALYFEVFGRLLRGEWGFAGRSKRPPRDPVNALLSFGYTLLLNHVATAVNIVGFDPYVGFLHSSQFGKPALALDVMEPFRPIIVDSVVLTVLNNGMLKPEDFREEFGAWWLKDGGRRTFIRKFEERLNTEVRHPIYGYRVPYRRCLELEARLVAKWLTGEVPEFRPFVVR